MTDAASAKRRYFLSARRRYLALWFPFLSADRLRIQEPERCALSPTPPETPLVLFARTGSALRLAAVDALGAGLGLAPGMTLADARARCPQLIAHEHDEPADRHWLERLTRAYFRFSPAVTQLPPDGIAIDITGGGHLFGGEQGLADLAQDQMAARGMTVRVACANTPEGAQALARYAHWPAPDERGAIQALPVVALNLGEEATRGLQRAGLKTVGAVAARPMATIAARFGIEAVRAIERLTGDESAPIASLMPRQALRFERRFAEPVAHRESVAVTLAELLHEAASSLEERRLGGRRFGIELHRSDGAVHRLEIATSAPTRDSALVLRLFAERIGALADPLDPGFGYDSMVLTVLRAEPLDPVQTSIPGATDGMIDDARALAELVDRLSTRLGPDAVRRLVPRDSHIPEQAQFALPAIERGAPAPWPADTPDGPPSRPLFLFDPPQGLHDVMSEVPDGPPRRFTWRRKLHHVRLYEGPERIAGEWWRRKGGELAGQGGLTRDYYRVEDVRGRRYWIFRHGLYEETDGPRWYVHGLFA